jgi:hypothetical protein
VLNETAEAPFAKALALSGAEIVVETDDKPAKRTRDGEDMPRVAFLHRVPLL